MPVQNNKTLAAQAPHTFCHSCGSEYDQLSWPRICQVCGVETYRNPLPAAVCLVPVDNGLLAVYRAIPPFGLALPGGFIEYKEDWKAAAARELEEEVQVVLNPDDILEHRTISSTNGFLLVFGLAPGISSSELPPFIPNDEVSERHIITSDKNIVFPIHALVISEYFASLKNTR